MKPDPRLMWLLAFVFVMVATILTCDCPWPAVVADMRLELSCDGPLGSLLCCFLMAHNGTRK